MTRRAAEGDRGERGNATGLVAVGVLLVGVLVAVFVIASAYRATAHRVQGAADLAAVAGGQAVLAGGDGGAAASGSASVNHVSVTSCRVSGDEIDFVVTVAVRGDPGWRPFGLSLAVDAHANAGVLQEES